MKNVIKLWVFIFSIAACGNSPIISNIDPTIPNIPEIPEPAVIDTIRQLTLIESKGYTDLVDTRRGDVWIYYYEFEFENTGNIDLEQWIVGVTFSYGMKHDRNTSAVKSTKVGDKTKVKVGFIYRAALDIGSEIVDQAFKQYIDDGQNGDFDLDINAYYPRYFDPPGGSFSNEEFDLIIEETVDFTPEI